MPRKARLDGLGALHHIIVRRIERRKIFRNDIDRDEFLKGLAVFCATVRSERGHISIFDYKRVMDERALINRLKCRRPFGFQAAFLKANGSEEQACRAESGQGSFSWHPTTG